MNRLPRYRIHPTFVRIAQIQARRGVQQVRRGLEPTFQAALLIYRALDFGGIITTGEVVSKPREVGAVFFLQQVPPFSA